jgi:hypothetical protein
LAQWKAQKLAASEKQSENVLEKAETQNKQSISVTKNGVSETKAKSTSATAISTGK